MKSNIVLFGLLAVFFFIVCVTYVVWNLITHGYIEWAGATALLLAGGLGGFIAVYLWLVQKKQGGVLHEDLDDADIDDGDPEIGEFSPWSWWPMVLAFSIAVFMLGLAVGFNFWLSYLAIPFIIVSMFGWVYEYYRGYFAR
jgi:hypothetical protein